MLSVFETSDRAKNLSLITAHTCKTWFATRTLLKPINAHLRLWQLALISWGNGKNTRQYYCSDTFFLLFNRKSPRDKKKVLFHSFLSQNTSTQCLKTLKPNFYSILNISIVSFLAHIHLAVPQKLNHCSVMSFLFTSFQDGRIRSVDAITDGFCKSTPFFL